MLLVSRNNPIFIQIKVAHITFNMVTLSSLYPICRKFYSPYDRTGSGYEEDDNNWDHDKSGHGDGYSERNLGQHSTENTERNINDIPRGTSVMRLDDLIESQPNPLQSEDSPGDNRQNVLDRGDGKDYSSYQSDLISRYFKGDRTKFYNEYASFIRCGAAECNGFDTSRMTLYKLMDMVGDVLVGEVYTRQTELILWSTAINLKSVGSKLAYGVFKAADSLPGTAVLDVFDHTTLGDSFLNADSETDQLSAFEFYKNRQKEFDRIRIQTLTPDLRDNVNPLISSQLP